MTMKVMTALAAVGFIAAGGAVFAGTDTDNMTVSATVNNSCTVTAGNLAFGTLTVTAGKTVETDNTATITVDCDVDETVTIGFGNGANDSSGRRLQSKAPTGVYIGYDLYSDSNRSTAITTGTLNVSADADAANGVDTTIYGRIPADQSITTGGQYEDTVVVTVTYTGT